MAQANPTYYLTRWITLYIVLIQKLLSRLTLQVPTFAYEKRLSRIETLRLAITYISFMIELVEGPAGLAKIQRASAHLKHHNILMESPAAAGGSAASAAAGHFLYPSPGSVSASLNC